MFSPPPYEPRGSGQASEVCAQADRASPVERTSPLLKRREPVQYRWLLKLCAFLRDHATRLASCVSRSTVESFRPHGDYQRYYTLSRPLPAIILPYLPCCRSDNALSSSRRTSRSAIALRLSYSRFPRASPIATFAYPRCK